MGQNIRPVCIQVVVFCKKCWPGLKSFKWHWNGTLFQGGLWREHNKSCKGHEMSRRVTRNDTPKTWCVPKIDQYVNLKIKTAHINIDFLARRKDGQKALAKHWDLPTNFTTDIGQVPNSARYYCNAKLSEESNGIICLRVKHSFSAKIFPFRRKTNFGLSDKFFSECIGCGARQCRTKTTEL